METHQEIRTEVLDATIKEGDEVGDREEEPTCLRLPDSEGLNKRDIVRESKQLDKENTMSPPHSPGKETPRSRHEQHEQAVPRQGYSQKKTRREN